MNRGIVQKKPKIEEKVVTWQAQIHNRFDVEVHDAITGKLKQKAEAFNVICDNLWNRLGSYFNYIVYSDGIGVPSASDTTTFGTWRYASASNHASVYDVAKGIAYRTRKIVLSETVAAGVTITEVGLASSTSSGNLCTHAMLQDMNGNPISIAKTSTDIITIYATVYVHFVPTGYEAGTIVIPPTGGVISYCLGNSLSFGEIEVGKGTCKMTTGSSSTVSATFNATTKKITCKAPRLAVGSGNVSGGFGWIMFGDHSGGSCTCLIDVRGRYEVSGESVGTGDGSTTEFATSFDLPSEAIVYVDGVPKTSGVTVKKEPITTDPFAFLVRIHPVLYEGKPVLWGGRTALSQSSRVYFYNTQAELGFYKWSDYHYAYMGIRMCFSDDFVNWSDFYNYGTVIPEQYRHCKYVCMSGDASSCTHPGYTDMQTGVFPPAVTGKNIIFDEPPAEGTVITIDYITPFVPKDSDHVYDLSLEIQLGEYTGEGV